MYATALLEADVETTDLVSALVFFVPAPLTTLTLTTSFDWSYVCPIWFQWVWFQWIKSQGNYTNLHQFGNVSPTYSECTLVASYDP